MVYYHMNNVERLKLQLEEARAELEALRDGLRDVKGYLTSPKFWEDRTVQVADVLLRIGEAEGRAFMAGLAVGR